MYGTAKMLQNGKEKNYFCRAYGDFFAFAYPGLLRLADLISEGIFEK